MTTKWFIGQTSERVFAIYKATFNGKILTSQKQWLIPTGEAWVSTKRVSEWYFVGNDEVWPATESEARKYLPVNA
jgi:hypothetical protein